MIRLLADFNDIHDDLVKALAADTDCHRPLAVDDVVLLEDDGEHEAWGTVVEVTERGLVSVRIDWDTWGAAGRYRTQATEGPTERWKVTANFQVRSEASTGRGGVRIPKGRRVGVAC